MQLASDQKRLVYWLLLFVQQAHVRDDPRELEVVVGACRVLRDVGYSFGSPAADALRKDGEPGKRRA